MTDKEAAQSDREALEKKYGFKLEDHSSNKKIKYLVFNDGRKYKLQLPSFMEMHELIFDRFDSQTALFRRGLQGLFSENEKSPNIDEDYCEENHSEARKWSIILRGLLSGFYVG